MASKTNQHASEPRVHSKQVRHKQTMPCIKNKSQATPSIYSFLIKCERVFTRWFGLQCIPIDMKRKLLFVGETARAPFARGGHLFARERVRRVNALVMLQNHRRGERARGYTHRRRAAEVAPDHEQDLQTTRPRETFCEFTFPPKNSNVRGQNLSRAFRADMSLRDPFLP